MAIPDFQSVMLPMLTMLGDSNEHSVKDTYTTLAERFKLTEKDLNEMLSSRNQTVFYNRVAWAKNYLKMGGLVENTKRGYFKITSLGLDILKDKPDIINIKFLKSLPTYQKYLDKTKEEKTSLTEEAEENETPEEIIEWNYLKIRNNLALELLSKVKACSPAFFENLVVELLVKMGYGGTIKEAGKATRLTNDGGIDGIIKEDRLGLDFIYIQAKRWTLNLLVVPIYNHLLGLWMDNELIRAYSLQLRGLLILH